MIFFKKEYISLGLRNIFLLAISSGISERTGLTARQEDLLEGRLPPDSLTSLVSLIVLELLSVLLVALSGNVKKDSLFILILLLMPKPA